MPDNTCICCGAIIPEGRQICLLCEGENEVQHFHQQIPPVRTNGDRIRAMTDEELVKSIGLACKRCAYYKVGHGECSGQDKECADGNLEWLGSEVRNE